MTLQEINRYWNVVNPISGCTLKEELENQQAWGGRLPYEARLSLIRRGIVSLKKKPVVVATGTGRKNNIMNKFNANSITIIDSTQSRIPMPSAQIVKE